MKERLPLISTIIPVYNVEKYLARCLDSVVSQTYSNLEIVIIDDGSTDCSGEICDRYKEQDQRIRVVHQPNQGQAAARNQGMNVASGEYISFIDSDDWVERGYIETLYKSMSKSNSDIAICGYKRGMAGKYQSKGRKEITKVFQNEEVMEKFLYRKISTSVCDKLYKSYLWDGICFPVGRIYEEVEPLFFLFKQNVKVVVTNQTCYCYDYRVGSTINQKFSLKRLDYVETCINLQKYVKRDCPQFEKAATSRLFWAEIHVLVHMDNQKIYAKEYKELIDDVKKLRRTVLIG